MSVGDEVSVFIQDEAEHVDVLVDGIHRSQGTVAVIIVACIRAGVALDWVHLSIGCYTAEGHRAHPAGVLEGHAVVVHKVRMHLQTFLAGRPEVPVVVEGPAVTEVPGSKNGVARAARAQMVNEAERVVPTNGH